MAGLEHFKFGHDAGLFDRHGHALQMLRRIDEHPVAHVEAAHVEAANVGLDLDHVTHAVRGRFEHAVRTGFRGVAVVGRETGARPGGEVDQHIAAACSDPLDGFAVQRAVHARLGGFRIAYMNMHDGGAGLGGINRRSGDLRGRDRDGGIAARRIGGAGHRARDHHLALHAFTRCG
jgi:hypothetical protein